VAPSGAMRWTCEVIAMKHSILVIGLWAISSALLAACAGSETPENGTSDGGGDSVSTGNSAGNTVSSSTASSAAGTGTGGGGVGGGGTGGGGTAGPDETPYFTTPELLCNYVN